MKFVHDDGGRAAAGFTGEAGDCVCRAIAIATGKPYREVYDALWGRIRERRERLEQHGVRTKNRSPRTGIPREIYQPFLESLGWTWTPTMAIGKGCTVHLRADELPAGRLIVRLSKHIAAVIDGVLHDLYDCSRDGTRCVYGYFREPLDLPIPDPVWSGPPRTIEMRAAE